MIKAVLFDLDETLITRAAAIRAFLADQHARYRAQLQPVTADIYASRFLAMEDNGRIGKDKVYPEFVVALGITGVDAPTLLEDYRTRYPLFAVMNPGAKETIAAIRGRGLKTGILSNGNVQVQDGKIDALGIRDLLDSVVISEGVGLRKPDPAIFLLAVEKLGIEPGETLFVGDNPEVDIVGAAGAGLQTAWFRNGETWPEGLLPRADVDIDRLDEVLNFPGK